MFNKPLCKSFFVNFIIFASLLLGSCNEDVNLEFYEDSIETSEAAIIAVNYELAKENNDVAKRINNTVRTYIAQQIFMGDDLPKDISIQEAIHQFNNELIRFKKDFPETPEVWEALIDGEVAYKSEELVCLAITSYLDTGGAHGNSYVRFLNFDAQTGSQLTTKDLILDIDSFKKIVENYLGKATKTTINEDTIENYFFGEDFKLPESIGFTDEGVVILYNTYEIAAYAQGTTEFTIPFNEVQEYLAYRFN